MGDIIPSKINEGLDLKDKDWSGLDLSGFIFKSCDLTGVNFSKCIFSAETDFRGSTFGKSSSDKVTNFSECNLTLPKFSSPVAFGRNANPGNRVNLTKATIPWALLGRTIENVDLTGAEFKNMPNELNAYTFDGLKWNDFNFEQRSLYNSSFFACDLTNCKMTGSVMDYVSFSQACNLTKVKMNKCSLVQTNFKGSTMTDTDLSYATRLEACSFLNTYLNGTIFDGNNLISSKFSVPNRMSKSKEHITSFQFATITTGFLTTNVQYNWQCMDLRNVIIDGFDTIKGNLTNLLAMNSLFNSSLDFSHAKLNGADFTGATFQSINFNNAKLNNVTFTSAKTIQGKQENPKAARFILPDTDPGFIEFVAALDGNDNDKIKKVFTRFRVRLDNFSCKKIGQADKTIYTLSLNDGDNKKQLFTIIPAPSLLNPTKSELRVFDESSSTFINASLIGCSMQDVNFSNADFQNAQLFGSQLIASDLSKVNFKAAQMGINADIFTVTRNNTQEDSIANYTVFLAALQNANIYSLIDIFKLYGFTLGNATCIPTDDNGSKWTITDRNAVQPVIYEVSQIIHNPASAFDELKVRCLTYTAATLDESYMPGVILTDANLTGCSAQGCHLYNNDLTSTYSSLTSTTLIDVNFTGANLYRADFTGATLSGTIFTQANLMFANFKNVTLEKTRVNASFKDANLQGADFSATKSIKDTSFLNAAVCAPLPDNRTYGVYVGHITENNKNYAGLLVDLNQPQVISLIDPYPLVTKIQDNKKISIDLKTALAEKNIKVSSNAMLKSKLSEWTFRLKDAEDEYYFVKGYDQNSKAVFNVFCKGRDSYYCNIPIVTLSEGELSSTQREEFKENSKGKLNLSAAARIDRYERPIIWSLKDENKEYTLWWGCRPGLDDAMLTLNIRESFRSLPLFCREMDIPYRDQSTLAQGKPLITTEALWELDLGSWDGYLLQPGYIKFKIVKKRIKDVDTLVIYGIKMRMIGLGNNQREVVQDHECEVTKLSIDIVGDQTIFPNKYTKSQNTQNLLPPDQWMWVKKQLPKPPECVPTLTSYCPMPKQLKQHKI